MKFLLDENMPAKVDYSLGDEHDVRTVQEMNWAGKKNGELIRLAVAAGFDFIITLDRNLKFQQNLEKAAVRFIVLLARNNKPGTIAPFVGKIRALIQQEAELSKLTEIKSD